MLDARETYDAVYRYCWFRLRDSTQAEDLAQETFLRFLGSRTYREEGKQLRYLYTIARNLCTEALRDRGGRACLPEEVPGEGFEQQAVSRVALGKALERLSQEEREMVFLRYVEEVPLTVMSGLYGMSRFALHRRLKRILAQLREELGEE